LSKAFDDEVSGPVLSLLFFVMESLTLFEQPALIRLWLAPILSNCTVVEISL
jgi:hypothetical protein